MCHACVMEGAKRHMLSRRDLFRRSAAVGATAVAAGTVSARAALADAHGGVVDLTHTLSPEFPTFFGVPGISMDKRFDFADAGFNLFEMTINEHTATHIDAPLHFSADGESVDEIDPATLVCPLCVIDIAAKASDDPNAMVEAEDVEAWIGANGDLPAGALVAMHSGWAAKSGDAAAYVGRAPGSEDPMAFPGFALSAAELLIEAGVAAIGVDTLSLDPGNSADFAVHYAWLPSGRYGIENLAGLDQVPASGATVFVGAPKHGGGTGGPARVLAMT